MRGNDELGNLSATRRRCGGAGAASRFTGQRGRHPRPAHGAVVIQRDEHLPAPILAAGDIARRVSASPSQMSFHLSALTDAGLIVSERDSRRIVYRARFERIGALVDFLLDDCCGGDPAVRACCGLGRSC